MCAFFSQNRLSHTQQHEYGDLLMIRTTDTTCMEILNHDVSQHSVAEVAPRCSPVAVVQGAKYSSFWGPGLQPDKEEIRRTDLPAPLSPQNQYAAP